MRKKKEKILCNSKNAIFFFSFHKKNILIQIESPTKDTNNGYEMMMIIIEFLLSSRQQNQHGMVKKGFKLHVEEQKKFFLREKGSKRLLFKGIE